MSDEAAGEEYQPANQAIPVSPHAREKRLSEMVPGIGNGTAPPHSLLSLTQAAIQVRSHSGPLPPAEDLQKYANISPKVLDTILEMAQKNNDTQNKTRRREQAFTFLGDLSKTASGLIFGCGCLLAAYELAKQGHPYIAGVLVTTTLTIGVSVLVMRVAPKGNNTPVAPPKQETPPPSE